jgi:short-subunit dehydrogenase
MYIVTGHTKGLGRQLITHLNNNKKKIVGLSRSKIQLDLNINVEEYEIDFSKPDFENLKNLKVNLSKYEDQIYFVINAFTYGSQNPDLHDLRKTLYTNLLNQLKCLDYLNILNKKLKVILIGSQEGMYQMSNFKGYTISKNIINNLPNYTNALNLQSHIIGPINSEKLPSSSNNILLKYFNIFFSLSYEELSSKIIKNISSNKKILLYQKVYFILKFPLVKILKLTNFIK